MERRSRRAPYRGARTPIQRQGAKQARFSIYLTIALATLGAGCGEPASEVTVTMDPCVDDLHCPYGQSCDLDHRRCVQGLWRDNYLHGQVSCVFGAPDDEDSEELGESSVTGALGGQRVAYIEGAACTLNPLAPDVVGVLAFGVRNGTASALVINVPVASSKLTGTLELKPSPQPYIPPGKAVPAYLEAFVLEDSLAVAFQSSGTVVIDQPAVKNGDRFVFAIDARFQMARMPPTCGIACSSQSDCGPMDLSLCGLYYAGCAYAGYDYPLCAQETQDGPFTCVLYCSTAGGLLCGSLAGSSCSPDPSLGQDMGRCKCSP